MYQVIGLPNLGNTCFFNSILQCLFRIPTLIKGINKYSTEDDPITQQLIQMYDHRETSPQRLIRYFYYKVGKKNRNPEDSHEMLLLLLDHLDQKTSYQVNYESVHQDHLSLMSCKSLIEQQKSMTSPVSAHFLGQFHQIVICSNCDYNHHSFQSFYDLTITLYTSISNIYDLLGKTFETEMLDEFNCDKCNKKKIKAQKKLSIWILPHILIITFKRFILTQRGYKKNSSYIDYPFNNLKIQRYVDDARKSTCSYDLICQISHQGNMNNGHYYSVVKTMDKNNAFVVANDDRIMRVDKVDQVVNNDSYVLFYRSNW